MVSENNKFSTRLFEVTLAAYACQPAILMLSVTSHYNEWAAILAEEKSGRVKVLCASVRKVISFQNLTHPILHLRLYCRVGVYVKPIKSDWYPAD